MHTTNVWQQHRFHRNECSSQPPGWIVLRKVRQSWRTNLCPCHNHWNEFWFGMNWTLIWPNVILVRSLVQFLVFANSAILINCGKLSSLALILILIKFGIAEKIQLSKADLMLMLPKCKTSYQNKTFKQWRTQKIFMGGFIQWHMVVICFWCTVSVTSQFVVIFMFPNQRFGEIYWHNMHILLHVPPLILCFIALNINYQRSKLGYRRRIHSMLRHRSS